MENFLAFFARLSLAMLLVNCVMLFAVERGSAEQVVTILSAAMMAAIFAVSNARLRKISKKGGESAQNKNEKENTNEDQH